MAGSAGTTASPGQTGIWGGEAGDELPAGPVRVVVTLRSEFLDRLRAVPGLADVDIDPFVLRPLDMGMLRRVVTEPAAVAESLLLATNSLLPYALSAKELGRRKDVEARAHRVADLLLFGLSRGKVRSR